MGTRQKATHFRIFASGLQVVEKTIFSIQSGYPRACCHCPDSQAENGKAAGPDKLFFETYEIGLHLSVGEKTIFR